MAFGEKVLVENKECAAKSKNEKGKVRTLLCTAFLFSRSLHMQAVSFYIKSHLQNET